MWHLFVIFFNWTELVLTEWFARANESWAPSGMPKSGPGYRIFRSASVAICEGVCHPQKLTQSFGKLVWRDAQEAEWGFPGPGQSVPGQSSSQQGLCLLTKSNEGESGTSYWQMGPHMRSLDQQYWEIFLGFWITVFGWLGILGTVVPDWRLLFRQSLSAAAPLLYFGFWS